MKTTLYLMVGIPASGKSTFSKKFVEDNPHVHRISSDEIRFELTGSEQDQTKNSEVFNALFGRVHGKLSNNKSVIVDATNIKRKDRKKFITIAEQYNADVVVIDIKIPLAKAIEFNNNRDRKVPEYVLKKMFASYQEPCYSEGITNIIVINQ